SSHSSLSVTPLLLHLHAPAPTEIYTLSLHDALPILPAKASSAPSMGSPSTVQVSSRLNNSASLHKVAARASSWSTAFSRTVAPRSEEHTSELQSRENLVCRLLLEKKKKNSITISSEH